MSNETPKEINNLFDELMPSDNPAPDTEEAASEETSDIIEEDYDDDDYEDGNIIEEFQTAVYGDVPTPQSPDMYSIDLQKKLENYTEERPEGEEYVDENSITIITELSEEGRKKTQMILDGLSKDVEDLEKLEKEAKEQYKSQSYLAKPERVYNKKAEMPKIVHAKALEGGNPLKKLLIFLIACVAVGLLFGVQANSFYIFKGGEVESTMSCVIGWLTVDDMPTKLSPLHSNVFGTGFFAGAGGLGIIGLFIYLDNDAKKASRVGHEHGAAHIAKGNDHKTYTARFMEAPEANTPPVQKSGKTPPNKSTPKLKIGKAKTIEQKPDEAGSAQQLLTEGEVALENQQNG